MNFKRCVIASNQNGYREYSSERGLAGPLPSTIATIAAAKGFVISQLCTSSVLAPDFLGEPASLPVNEFPKWKRALDVVVALLLRAFLFPILMVVAALVAMDGGPIIYRQQRMGMSAKRLVMLKFRTMCQDADQSLLELPERDKGAAAHWTQYQKLPDDPRITKVGKFLRKSSLDEFPQLINVLAGSMSMVGPRPIVESEIIRYRHYIRDYYRSRPGVTGLWQVSGRSDVSYRRRIAFDTLYIRKLCRPTLDVKLIAMTIPAILIGRGAR
jgi:exopolysaccharide production protein ExoY